MKALNSLLLIFTLLTSSCAQLDRLGPRTPASVGMSGNCVQLAAPLIEADYTPTQAESILSNLLGNDALSKNLTAKYRYLIRESELDDLEASLLREILEALPTDEKRAERIFSFVQFARSRPHEREKILQQLPAVIGPQYNTSNNHWVNSFKKLEDKITKYIDKREQRHLAQIPATNREDSTERWAAWKKAYEEGKIYRSLSFKCSNKALSSTTPKQAKLLTKAFTAGSVGSAVATYSFINWDKEKDGRWYGELGWTLFWASLFGYLNGKYVFSNPKLKPWLHRLPLTFGVTASEDALISALYSPVFNSLFGDGSEANLEKLSSIENDPKAQEMIKELLEIMEREGIFEKYQKETMALFSKQNEHGEITPMTWDEIQNLNPEELDITLGQDMFLEAMAEQEYAQNMGPLSFGGSASSDRYVFHRMLDVAYVPINIQLGLVMNHQICMSPDPKVGMLKAVSTFMMGKMLMDSFYFWSRRQSIGQ